MKPGFISSLVKGIDNVTMVKESSGDIQRMHQLYSLSGGEIPFYNGSNPLALEAFGAGAVGWCTAAPNLIPELTRSLYEATQKGDLVLARELFYRQLPVLDFILKGGLPTTVKGGLKLQGFAVGEPRMPLLPLSDDQAFILSSLLASLEDSIHAAA